MCDAEHSPFLKGLPHHILEVLVRLRVAAGPGEALCDAPLAARGASAGARRRYRRRGPMLGLTQLSNYLTLKGSFSAVSNQILQVNMRWKALAEIYKMQSFAPFWKLNIFV